MQYRNLGRTGLRVSALCLGTYNFGEATPEPVARNIMAEAIDRGINIFDTANSYGAGESERIIGRFLKETGQRHRVIVTTKVYDAIGDGPNDRGLSRFHILQACEDSLRRLETDHIDLYLAHRSASMVIPVDETLGAFTDLVRQGKVRYVGASTHPAWHVMEALMVSELRGYVRYVAESPPYNLLDRRAENELVPLCERYGLGILPWAPLGMGVLAGRYTAAGTFPKGSRASRNPQGYFAERVNRAGIAIGARLTALAPQYGLTSGQLALLWLKDQPGVTSTIVGMRTVQQMDESLVIADMNANDTLRTAMDELNPPGTAVTNFHNTSGWLKTRLPEG